MRCDLKSHPTLISCCDLLHRWPESGEPSSYETSPFFPPRLPEDDLDLDLDLDLALLARLGGFDSPDGSEPVRLLLRLREGDLRLSSRGEA